MLCPNCGSKQFGEIVCDNDCGTCSCIVCDKDWYYDGDKYIIGHSPLCGVPNVSKVSEVEFEIPPKA